MNYKIINNKKYLTLDQLVNKTGLSKTTIESYRNSELISTFRFSQHKFYYQSLTILELRNIKGFESLRRLFTSKQFKQNNVTYHNTNFQLKQTLLEMLHSNLDVKKSGLLDMILYTDHKLSLRERFVNYYEKKAPSQTIDSFQLRYGMKLGEAKYKEKCNTLKNSQSIDGFKKRYGTENGEKLFNDRISKTKNTKENFIKRYGYDVGIKKYEEFKNNIKHSEEKFISLYGEEDGKNKWNDFLKNIKNTKQNFIKKYGKEFGIKRYEEFKNNVAMTLEKCISFYGEKEGIIEYNKISNLLKSLNKKDYYIEKYGEEIGVIKWENKINSGFLKASKESLEIFEPLTKHLLNIGIEMKDIFYGINESTEFKIENGDKLYSYDYTILSKKIIIEFNGNHVHPSKELLGENWDSWRCVWTGETADQKHSLDMEKLMVAEKHGFTVIEIWDYEDKVEALEKCIKFVEEKI